jgi:hypothetical protein
MANEVSASTSAGRLGPALRRVLSHPLALVVVGAAVSTLLVPLYTQQAQENQQALEIRRDLAERMSATVSPFLAATLSNELVWRGKPPTDYDLAYETWSTESDVILTRMRTHLDDAGIAETWQDYQVAVRWLYYLFKVGNPAEGSRGWILSKPDYLGRFVRKYTACGETSRWCLDIDIAELARFHIPPRGINPSLDGALRRLLTVFRLENEALVDRVLEADVRL